MALIAEYGFPEGSGTTTADSSGNSRNLTFSGSWEATAKNGPGLGSGGAATGAMGPNSTLTNYTIMAWVKWSLPAAGTYYGVLNNNAKFLEASLSGGAILLDWFGGASTINATSTFPANTATHVAVTVTGASTATLYINGVAAGTGNGGTTGINFSTACVIGAGNGDIGPAAGDWVDEVRIFDAALTAGEITTWMNTSVGGVATFVNTFETWAGSNGAAWPAQWTTAAMGGTIDIQSNKGRQANSGAANAHGPTALLSGMSAVSNVDVTVFVTIPANTNMFFVVSTRADVFDTGLTYPVNGILLMAQASGQAWIRRIVSSAQTDVTSPAQYLTTTTGMVMGLRLQVVGAAYRAKLWDAAGSEPAAWTMSFTDGSPYTTAGKVGLSVFTIDTVVQNYLFDDLTVSAPPPEISLRAAGATLAATVAVTAINPLVPATATTGDLSVLGFGGKPFGITPTTPTNWTKIGEATNGTVANSAADLGSTKVAAYTRISAPVGAIGAMTVGGTPDTLDAVINTYAKDPTYTWDAVAFTSAADATNGANFSATGAAWTVQTGDWIVAVCSVNGDVGTVTAITIGGMSGATLGTTVTRTNHAVTTGFDNRLIVADVAVTAGSSAAAPTFAYTNASSTSGTVLWLRLRQIAPAVAVAPVPIMFLQAINRAADW